MNDERFTVWVQIEGSRDDASEWNVGLPDRLSVFETEAEARAFVTTLLTATRSPDAETSEQLLYGLRPAAVCIAEAIARNQTHFCGGCGRCMVGGCDGRLTLHHGDCSRVFCLWCGGQFAGAGEADPCTCVTPSTDSPFCENCGEMASTCACGSLPRR